MHAPRRFPIHLVRAALFAAALLPSVRAADDVVQESEPAPPVPAQNGVFGGQVQGGRVIIMPGLRLNVGGQGRLQVQGNVVAPGAVPAADGATEPYLGVATSLVAPAVRAQLDLPDGVGLMIDAVAAGSPAEKAGIRQFDVIHTFNDQVICSPEQLTTLVRLVGAGTKVPLKLRRGGRERVVEAVLEERVMTPDAADDVVVVDGIPGVLNLRQMPPGVAGGLGPEVQADIERKLAEALARAGIGRGLMPGFMPGMGPGMMPGVVPGAAGNVRAQVLTIGPGVQSATVVSDARGTVEIRSAGGRKTVTVKDPAGVEVYTGPLDTADDLDRVPDEYREWVRGVDAGQAVAAPRGPEAEEPAAEPEPADAAAAARTT